MKTNLLPLSKEGISYFFFSFSFFLFFFIIDFAFLAFVAFFITLFIGFSFRNPERELCLFETGSLLAPIDGIVESIVELDDHEFAYKIEVYSSFSDVGVLRVPANATVSKLTKQNGTRVSKNSKLFNSLNENVEVSFLSTEGNSFKVLHTLQQSFAPLCVELKDNQKLVQSARYGFMLNGYTTVYLPHNFRVNISIGSELKASESLMGYFS